MPAPGYEIGRRNRERVRRYFETHLCATNRECSASIGMSVEAVGRHVMAIRAEWTDMDDAFSARCCGSENRTGKELET